MKNILLEELSPFCPIQAFVEEYDDCVYFYLWDYPGEEYARIRSCWVRNYKKAPESLDRSDAAASLVRPSRRCRKIGPRSPVYRLV